MDLSIRAWSICYLDSKRLVERMGSRAIAPRVDYDEIHSKIAV